MAQSKKKLLRQSVTIRDVARDAGVSIGTVSKALNDQGQLRKETRAKVRTAAELLGFRPNDLAQSLHRKRSFTVGLITSDRFGRFSIPLLEGFEEALDLARVSVFLCKPTDDKAHERRHVDVLLSKRVDGIIVTSRRTDPRAPIEMLGSNVPVIYAYAQTAGAGTTCLLPDDEGGGHLAGSHLASLGRKRIAHITGPSRFAAVRDRRAGLGAAMRAAGSPLDPRLTLMGDWSEDWGRTAIGRLLEANLSFDAVFCGSDQIARGVADSLRDAGLRVPDDVALIGYDNWEIIAAATRPPLTTIDPCLHDLGKMAALRLLKMIEGETQPETIRVPCRLVVRQSCGAEPDWADIKSQAALKIECGGKQ